MGKCIWVLGADGFCGWPSTLHLSNLGYDVVAIDNFARRNIDVELGCQSLTPIEPLEKRIKVWKELTGKEIRFEYIDISEHYHRILSLLKETKPEAIVHFAEMRAAPYCFTTDVEVLTNNGFKLYNELKDNDEIATVNIKTEKIEYQIPEKINVFDYDGYLENFERFNENFLCTPDHEFIHRQNIKNTNNFKYIKTKAKNRKTINIPTFFEINDKKDLDINDDWFKIAGWIVSEGCYHLNRGKYQVIEIGQNKIINKNNCMEIENFH